MPKFQDSKPSLRIINMVFIMLMAVTFLSAQDKPSKRPSVSEVPYKKVQALSVLEGNWEVQTKYSPDGGATWSASPAHQVQVEIMHKGMVLAEQVLQPTNEGFTIMSFLSYDQYRNVYRFAAIDDVWGLMDIYEGTIQNEKLVLTNLKAKTFFPIGDGKWRGFRLILELKDHARKMIIDATDDYGESWKPAFIVDYKKVG